MSGTVSSGEIVTFGPGNRAIVRLSDGGEVKAVLALRQLRARHGCLFGNPVGWRVAVELSDHLKLPRVIEIHPEKM